MNNEALIKLLSVLSSTDKRDAFVKCYHNACWFMLDSSELVINAIEVLKIHAEYSEAQQSWDACIKVRFKRSIYQSDPDFSECIGKVLIDYYK